MKEDSILAVGSVALDSIETPFGKAVETLGGSASYFSAAARFFKPTRIVAVVGQDFPKKHLALFKRLKINTDQIEIHPTGRTFRWEGRYNFDLNTAQTLKTELNVFQTFRPVLDARSKECPYVFLANIDPVLQKNILFQAKRPKFTACDTMNYWIETKKPELLALMKHVDIVLCNDAEAREISKEFNLMKAANFILNRGPKLLVIKKGEHGVLCFSKKFLFAAPAFLLEKIFDPTGAGDSFAGGFVGYLAKTGRLDEKNIRQAVVYGSVLASYNVESFSLTRLAGLKPSDIQKRYSLFRRLTHF